MLFKQSCGYATTLPRQQKHVFRPKYCCLVYCTVATFALATQFRHEASTFVEFGFVTEASTCCRVVANLKKMSRGRLCVLVCPPPGQSLKWARRETRYEKDFQNETKTLLGLIKVYSYLPVNAFGDYERVDVKECKGSTKKRGSER